VWVVVLNGLLPLLLKCLHGQQVPLRIQIQQYQVPVSMVLALHFLPVVPIKSIWEEPTLVKPVPVVLPEDMVEHQEQSMGQYLATLWLITSRFDVQLWRV
jgi:hypothetical protein